jgi:hypothetical protein
MAKLGSPEEGRAGSQPILLGDADLRVGPKPEPSLARTRPLPPGADMVERAVRCSSPRMLLSMVCAQGRRAPAGHFIAG